MILTDSSAANVGATAVTAIASATGAFRQFMCYADTTISLVISGTIGLIKNGAGILTLTENNTYSGGTMINDGYVVAENQNALGTGQVTLNSTNAGLILSNGTYINNLLVTDNLNSKFLGVFFDGINTYAPIWSGTILINETSALGFIISSASGDSITISGNISGAGSITKQNPGFLFLSGNNSFTGGITISSNGGIVVVNNNNALGTGSATLAGSNAKIYIGNGVTISNTIIVSDTGGQKTILVETGESAVISNVTNNETGFGNFRFDTESAALLNVAGVISGVGSITKIGTGLLTLSGTCNYTGQTQINSGTLEVTGASTLNGVISGSGTLRKTGTAVLTIGGNNTYSGGTSYVAAGTSAYILCTSSNAFGTGLLTVSNAVGRIDTGSNVTLPNNFQLTTALQIRTLGANTITVSGNIAGGGSLTKSGNGTLILSGTLTYTGQTIITGLLRAFQTTGASTATATFNSAGSFIAVSFNVSPPSGVTTFRFFQGSTASTWGLGTLTGVPAGTTATYNSTNSTLSVTVP
jgi:fibronectin-binding autotransporter adhesin